jgi:hypothetical protein
MQFGSLSVEFDLMLDLLTSQLICDDISRRKRYRLTKIILRI